MLLESEEDDSLMMMENDLYCCLLTMKRESDEDEWFSVYGYGVWSYFNVEWNKEEDEVGVMMLCKMMKEVLLLCWKKRVVVMKFFLVIVMFLVLWRMSFMTDFMSFCDVISGVIIFLKMMKMFVVYVMDKKSWIRGWVMKVTEMRLGGVKWWRFSFDDDDETYSSPICFRCTLIYTNRKSCFPQYFLFCFFVWCG